MKVYTKANLKGNLTFLGKNSSLYLRTAVFFLSISFFFFYGTTLSSMGK